MQVITTVSQDRQQESLIIGRRKPGVDFQNKFKLSNDFERVKTSVMLRGRGGVGVQLITAVFRFLRYSNLRYVLLMISFRGRVT